MNHNPSISVIMPVYNAANYVRESVQSIINQTYIDFEFIIIDDGSIDESLQIIESFTDKRIWIIKKSLNTGNYHSRNDGMKIAKGKYICVMDAADIELPERFEKQYVFTTVPLKTGG